MLSSCQQKPGEELDGSTHHQSVRQLHSWRHEPARVPRSPHRVDRLGRGGHGAAAAPAERLRQGATVPADDPRLAIETTGYDTPDGKVTGYLARLKAKGKRPARRRDPREPRAQAAHQGRRRGASRSKASSRFGVDLLSHHGRHAQPTRTRRATMIGKLNLDDTAAQLAAAVPFLDEARRVDRQGRRGRLLLGRRHGQPAGRRRARAQRAASPITARQIPAGRGAEDHGAAAAALRGARRARSTPASRPTRRRSRPTASATPVYVYEGANHAFNNDTNAARYNKEAADLAWGRTLAFFKENLGAPKGA